MLIQLVVFFAILGAGLSSDASEVMFRPELPSGKVSVNVLIKDKKPGWMCAWVKIGKKGNTNTVNDDAYWFPESLIKDDDALESKADDLLEAGKKVVRCTLKQYDREKNKMRNADFEGDAD